MRFSRVFLAAILTLTGSLAQANVIFDIDGANSSVSVSTDPSWFCLGCGIAVQKASALDSAGANLAVGQSFDFNFFDLTFYGLGGATGDITATVMFSAPGGGSVATGTGGFFTLFGVANAGVLNWDEIAPVVLADGTSFQLSLPNLRGLAIGTTTIAGTITLLSEPGARAVSEPSTILLLGAGLFGFALLRRRKV